MFLKLHECFNLVSRKKSRTKVLKNTEYSQKITLHEIDITIYGKKINRTYLYIIKKLMKKKKNVLRDFANIFIFVIDNDIVVSPHVFERVAWCRPPGDPAM